MSAFFYQPGIPDGKNYLEEEEANHCARVLRHKPGDHIMVMDGKGTHYDVELTTTSPRLCDFKIIKSQHFPPNPYMVQLAIAPTKSIDRIEWMAEKCVELGMHKLTFIQCDHSERTRLRIDRIEKKMIAAMKQSKQAYAPELEPEICMFDDFLQKNVDKVQVHVAYAVENEDLPHLKDKPLTGPSCVVIGPEGDFSNREIELVRSLDIPLVSLGPHRLRTETAGLAAVHILQLLQQ